MDGGSRKRRHWLTDRRHVSDADAQEGGYRRRSRIGDCNHGSSIASLA